MARPTDYKSSFNKQAEKLCRLGATDKELAEFFEIVESTINEWKIKYPKFSESIKKGKVLADIKVADSLYKRANGYKYNEVTFEKVGDKDTLLEDGDETIKVDSFKKKIVTKEIAPDVTAQIFWLKNRQKKKWRDKIETGITDVDGNDVQTVIYQVPDNGRRIIKTETSEGLPGEVSQ